MSAAQQKGIPMNENQVTQPPQPPDDPGPRSFAVLLQRLDDGVAIGELDRELQALGKALYRHNKFSDGKSHGELKLTIKMDVEGGAVTLGYDITVKEPKRRRNKTALFLTEHGNLSDTMPKQQNLFGSQLRDVSAPGAAQNVPASGTVTPSNA